MLDKQLIINANHSETRMALLENGRMAELFVERSRDQGLVGSIFKGVVTRVLPGMNSAFVDIGHDKSAFLFGGDVLDPDADYFEEIDQDSSQPHLREKRPIEQILKDGQTIIVQVSKEPLGTKGPRITMYLTLPGRYLVLMPHFKHVGISRRIEDEEERERIKGIVDGMVPEGCGVIIRTAAVNMDKVSLENDLKYLSELWAGVDKTIAAARPPSLLFRDLDIMQKVTRDLYDDHVSQIIVDDNDAYIQLSHFLESTIPSAKEKLHLHEDRVPVFDLYGIEIDIGRALSSRVELPSGGYLVIEQTEALTSFDVNTGKFVGKANARQTILKTNLEATKKVVEQLRIRNIGGIIIVDFIDMEDSIDREDIYQALMEELKTDRARTNVLKVSELGLVQMTRKRTSESLGRRLQSHCPYCDGNGHIRSTETEAYDLIREISRCHIQTGATNFKVRVRPDIRQWIEEKESALFEEILRKYEINVDFEDTSVTTKLLREPGYEVSSEEG